MIRLKDLWSSKQRRIAESELRTANLSQYFNLKARMSRRKNIQLFGVRKQIYRNPQITQLSQIQETTGLCSICFFGPRNLRMHY